MRPDYLNPDSLRSVDRQELISIIGALEDERRTVTAERNRLLAIGDNVPNGALIQIQIDTNTPGISITNLSRTWTKLTGLNIKKTIKNASVFLATVYPDDLPVLMEKLKALARIPGPVYAEFRFYNRRKNIRWLQLSATRYKDGDKLIADGFISDITQQKSNEHKLVLEKEWLKAIGDNLPGGALIRTEIDLKTKNIRLTYLSKTWEKITDLSVEESLADMSKVFALIHPDDLPALDEAIRKSARQMSTLNMELRFYNEGKGMRWVHLSSHPHQEEDKIVSDGIISDITERKRIQQKQDSYRDELKDAIKVSTQRLRESNEQLAVLNEELQTANEEQVVLNEELQSTNEELYGKNIRLEEEVELRKNLMVQLEHNREIVKNFIEQSFEGIVIINNEGKIIEWNRQHEKITGIARDAAIGRYEWEILAEHIRNDNPVKFKSQLRKSRLSFLQNCKKQKPIVEERIFIMPDGTDRFLFSSIFPIILSGTCFIGIITHDITERKKINAELEQYRTQLEQMVEQKTRELSNSRKQLVMLSNNLHGGIILQIVTGKGNAAGMKVTFISDTVVDLFGIKPGEIMKSAGLLFSLFPDDVRDMFSAYFSGTNRKHIIQYESKAVLASGQTKWIHVRLVKHRQEQEKNVWEGFMIDITQHKMAELELEKIRIRQALLIDIMQAIQFSARLDDAIKLALAKIGSFLNLSRIYTFVKTGDGDTLQNNYEWCNEGIAPQKDDLQDVPLEAVKDWFYIFDLGEYICTSDIRNLSSGAYRVLAPQGIKALVVLPMVNNGVCYGFMGFEDCLTNRQWEQREVDMLKDLARVISESILRCWAEKSLKRSRHTLRTVLDNINASIFVVDYESTEILFANKQIKQQMDDSEIEGRSCSQVVLNENMPVCFCPNRELLDKEKYPGGILQREYQNPKSKKWYECIETAIEWVNGKTAFMEFLTDITTRKNTEEALRQSEEMYRRLILASPYAIIMCDTEMKVLYASPKTRELLQKGDQEVAMQLNLKDYVHPHDRKKIVNIYDRIVREDVVVFPNLLLVREDGSEFFGEVSMAPVRNDENEIISIILVVHDITARKNNEIELVRAKEKAEESDMLKSAFLANMSHEIRTPLNGINGFLHFLSDDKLSSSRRQEYVNIIRNSSNQLVRIIDDIVDLSKIEARQMDIHPTLFDLNGLMAEIHVFFETYLETNNKDKIMLIADNSGSVDNCTVYADPVRLRQVLMNLLNNAIKFTEKGYVQFGYRIDETDMLEFHVEDTGIGLNEKQVNNVFNRFWQAETGGTRNYGGAGLGLTISKNLVQLMGGEMRVSSAINKGSIFHFTISYIPVADEDKILFTEKENTVEKPKNRLSVLFVEPGIMKYKYYEGLLSRSRITLLHAADTQQWLEHISRSVHIDMAFVNSDIFKSKSNGTISEIKSVRADLPVILIVNGRENEQCECRYPYHDVIREPLNYSKLYKTIERIQDYPIQANHNI